MEKSVFGLTAIIGTVMVIFGSIRLGRYGVPVIGMAILIFATAHMLRFRLLEIEKKLNASPTPKDPKTDLPDKSPETSVN